MIENVVEYRYEQVAAKITHLIHRGTLRPGERIPSVRRISRQHLDTPLEFSRSTPSWRVRHPEELVAYLEPVLG